MPDPTVPDADRQARIDALAARLRPAARRMAEQLVDRPDAELFGEVEYRLRDAAHDLAAAAHQAGLDARKGGVLPGISGGRARHRERADRGRVQGHREPAQGVGDAVDRGRGGGGVPGVGDTAYLGTDLHVPTRKPRGRPLTRRQKAGNRRLARRRVLAEHGIGKMKVWRIAADRYRNPRSRHTVMMKNVAGLHNRMFG